MTRKSILLLKPGILSLKNSIKSTSRGAVLRRLPFTALGLIFWVLFYIGTYKVVSYIRGIEIFGELIAVKLLSMVFFSLLGFLLLSNLITAISSFYLSRDIPFLVSKPVGHSDILVFKTFQTVVSSSWMVLSFIPPVFIGFGTAYGAPSSYYIFVFLFFILFILITAGIGISATHVLTRLFPAKKVRDVFLFTGLLLFLLAYFVFRSSVPENTENPIELIETVMAFKTDSPLMPSTWITESAMSILRGRSMDFLYIVLLASNSVFFLMLSLTVGERLFRGNLERLQTGGSRRQPASRLERKRGVKSFYPGPGLALLYKDTKLFLRDTAQWSQLLIILALAFVYIYNFKSLPLDVLLEFTPLAEEIIVLVNMLMAGLVLSAVAARFLYSSVSLEGQAFQTVKVSPIGMKRFLLSKFVYGSVPVTVLTLSIMALTNLLLDVRGMLMFASMAALFLLCISISGLGTGLGAIHPRFKYENIASVSISLGGMTFMLLAFGVVLLTLALVAWPFYAYYRTGGPVCSVTALSVILMLAVNSLVFYLPMRAGIRKLRDMNL